MKLQLELDFESKRYSSFRISLIEAARSYRGQQAELATKLDRSPSNLSRRLSLVRQPNEPDLNPDDIEGILEQTGSIEPIYYLIEKFMKKPEDKELKEFREFKREFPNWQKLREVLKPR